MSEQTEIIDQPPAEPGPANEEKARRARTTYPIRVLIETAGTLTLVDAAGDFSEQRAADAWIVANGTRGQAYRTARLGPKVRPMVTLEVEA